MNLLTLTRSAVVAVILAWLVTFLPGLRNIQAVEAAGAPRALPRSADARTRSCRSEVSASSEVLNAPRALLEP